MKKETLVARLLQIWIVGRCRCFMRRTKSESHLNCFKVDKWVVEGVDELLRNVKLDEQDTKEDEFFTESLDSLVPLFSARN